MDVGSPLRSIGPGRQFSPASHVIVVVTPSGSTIETATRLHGVEDSEVPQKPLLSKSIRSPGGAYVVTLPSAAM